MPLACDSISTHVTEQTRFCRHDAVRGRARSKLVHVDRCATCPHRQDTGTSKALPPRQVSHSRPVTVTTSSHTGIDPDRCDVVIPYCQTNLRWLGAAVESILNQTGVECVLHLIADGFDRNDDPALKYAGLNNVRLYRHNESIGPYRSTNRIVDRLETDLLAIQDSDDIALPHRLRLSIGEMLRARAEMWGGAMMQFATYESRTSRTSDKVNRVPIHKSGWHPWRISPDGALINGTRLLTVECFRRLGGFAAFRGSSDCEFTTRAIRSGVKICMSNEVVALRRVHGESLSYGSAYGVGSASRKNWHAQILESYKRMVPGFDPAQFGNLPEDLAEAHLTRRIA